MKTFELKQAHEQKPFTVFSSMRVIVIWSATAIGAMVRYSKKFHEKPDGVMPGAMVH